MTIDREQLQHLSTQAGDLLAHIQEIAGRENITEARVKFPRGYIRTTEQTRAKLPIFHKLLDETKMRNICYSLQMADLLRWLAIRTDLGNMLLSQVAKEYICIHGHATDYILAASCVELGVLSECSSKPFNKRSSLLVVNNHIKPATKQEIDWIWDIRCREHPDKLDVLETTDYGRKDANRARKAFEGFCEEVAHAIVGQMSDVIED